jgi:hypothetical protein
MSTPTTVFLEQMKDHMKTMNNLSESFRKLASDMSATIESVEVGDAPIDAAALERDLDALANDMIVVTPAAPAPVPLNRWQILHAEYTAKRNAKMTAAYNKMISICNVIPSPASSLAFDNHYMAMQRLATDLAIEYQQSQAIAATRPLPSAMAEYGQNKTNALGCRIDRLKEYEKGCWRTIKPHGQVMIYKYSVWKIVESPNAIDSVRYLGAINPETKEIHKNAAPAIPPAIAEWNWF